MPERGAKPDYQDVLAAIEEARGRAGRRLQVRVLGQSVEGRDIPCVVCTDPELPDESKQRVLVVAGQHGTKESGRAIALALMEWLISEDAEAEQVLRRQVVAIIPCANPDAAQRDTKKNAKDVDIARSYHIDAPSTSQEGWLIERFALALAPEVLVDIFGRSGGSMREHTTPSPTLPFCIDRTYQTIMCLEMARVAEEAGFPQTEFRIPAGLDEPRTNTLGEKMAKEAKSLSFQMETIEQYYGEAEWRASGMVRLRRLLRYGMEDAFGLGAAGYPNHLVSGTRTYGLMAHGTTPAARRQNRVELATFLRTNFASIHRGEDGLDRCATMRVESETCHGHSPQRFSMVMRIKKPCRIESVEWHGEPLCPDSEHGYETWEDRISVMVKANVLEPFGGEQRFLSVRYASPLFDAGGWPAP